MTSSVIKNPSGERIDISFHPGRNRSSLVILGHGVTGNKDRPLLLAIAKGLSAKGWPCMRVSFSGNGNSEGRFEEATVTKESADLQAILDAVPDWVGVAYAGHSMGAAVGVSTASKDLRIGLLISLAGMVRTADFVKREFGNLTPGKDCMWDEPACPLSEEFVGDLKSIGDVLETAATVTQPWLLIHGTDDDLVPIQDSRDAHKVAVCQKKLIEIPGAGHSFDVESYPEIIEAIDQWLSSRFGKE
jgi:uncharacterized protein